MLYACRADGCRSGSREAVARRPVSLLGSSAGSSWETGRSGGGLLVPQALFLSTAVSLNSTQLLPLFNWFRKRLHVASVGGWGPRLLGEILPRE